MTATGYVATYADVSREAADDNLAALMRRLVDLFHHGTTEHGDGVSRDCQGLFVSSSPCEGEYPLVVSNTSHVVNPDGQRPGAVGAADEVVSCAVDDESNFVLPG